MTWDESTCNSLIFYHTFDNHIHISTVIGTKWSTGLEYSKVGGESGSLEIRQWREFAYVMFVLLTYLFVHRELAQYAGGRGKRHPLSEGTLPGVVVPQYRIDILR
jgi:hypothetical protein